ncbi:polysaccharide pyruvyl transferase family protein [Roseivirga echinicomitans]|uniref:Polysaccharide pyruvyl transferase domain-containing protein n=1 Tax=Roseivirga echinicomitans TaxID=296218 RepID=A0A150XW39_9BACT|nr:polysaccharide pyruvyl transferase family protein [Roseivirga echinicomitans]KYG82845.1 hypothetical protein AWN68_13755 [Roseivirga echinicomitans]
MKKLRVLQLASYQGNIGDNANLTGTRRALMKNLDFKLEFHDLEIREFFWKERFYDVSFADTVNEYDLFIFGGGNFFELWVDHSSNNTSVDIDISILKKIKTPTVFYSLGMDPGMGVSEKGVSKFKKWLDYVISQERFVLSLRNDGSRNVAKKYLGNSYAKHFHFCPDGGLFTEVPSATHPEIEEGMINVGMNLAGDMMDVRFPMDTTESIDSNTFLTELGQMFNNLFNKHDDLRLVLYPHIYKDLEIISRFTYKMNDKQVRKKVSCAPYLTGFEGQDYIFDSYLNCQLIMGNRFHTNICAMGLNIPSIGFINYRQIHDFYEEIDMLDRSVEVNMKGFSKDLELMIEDTLTNGKEVKKAYSEITNGLKDELNSFHFYLNNWLKQIIGH